MNYTLGPCWQKGASRQGTGKARSSRVLLLLLLLIGAQHVIEAVDAAPAARRLLQQPATALEFLQRYVSGRTFCQPLLTERSEDGAFEVENEHETQLSVTSARPGIGFVLNINAIIRQTVWLVEDGKRVEPGQIVDRAVSETCFFGVRASTGEPSGLCFDADASGAPEAILGESFTPMAAYSMRLAAGGRALLWSERPATPYIDVGDAPGDFEANLTFSLSTDGTTTFTDAGTFYSLDPASGRRGNPAPRPTKAWRQCKPGGVRLRPGGRVHAPRPGDEWEPWGRQGVFDFLKANVDGRTFPAPERAERSPDGRSEVVRRGSARYSGLSRTYDGFFYLVEFSSQGADYAFDPSTKQRAAKPRSPPRERARTLRCQYGVRRTGAVQGVCWPAAAEAGVPFTAYSSVLTLAADGKSLEDATATLVPFEDLAPRGGGKARPGAQERVVSTTNADGSVTQVFPPFKTLEVDPRPPFARKPTSALLPSSALAQP